MMTQKGVLYNKWSETCLLNVASFNYTICIKCNVAVMQFSRCIIIIIIINEYYLGAVKSKNC